MGISSAVSVPIVMGSALIPAMKVAPQLVATAGSVCTIQCDLPKFILRQRGQ